MESELPPGRRRAPAEPPSDDSANASSAELAAMWSQVSQVHMLRESEEMDEAYSELWAQLALLPILGDQERLLRAEAAEVTYYLKVFVEAADLGTRHEAASLAATFIDVMAHRRPGSQQPDEDAATPKAEASPINKSETVSEAEVAIDVDRDSRLRVPGPPQATPRFEDNALQDALVGPDPLTELRRSLEASSPESEDRDADEFWDEDPNRPGFGVLILAALALAAVVAVSLYLAR